MRSPPSPRIPLPSNKTAHSDIGETRHLAVTKRDVEVLAVVAIGVAVQQRGHDAVGCVETGCQVCDCDADFDGRAVTRAGDVHKTEFAGTSGLVVLYTARAA